MQKIIAIVFLMFSTLFLASTADACVCDTPPPACYDYWRTDAVFVGTVSNVVENPENPLDIKVNVSIEQNFKGMGTASGVTQNGMTSCSFNFKTGDKYLFYADLYKGDLYEFGTGYCHRTRPFSSSLSDLGFLDAVRNNQKTYWIWATISRGVSDTGIKGVRAEVIDTKTRISSVSDENGDIRLVVPGEGKYKVRIYLPEGMSPSGSMRNDLDLYKEQRRIIKGGKLKGKIRYLDYEVSVEPNRCGWIDLDLANFG